MPSDISEAVTQDQIADSLMGEPATDEQTQQTVAEEPAAEVEDQPTVEEGETQTEQETADDWLPTEQEKVFPPEVLEKYAPRYGFTADELQGDPRIARIVQDKLNSDIYIDQLTQQQQLAENQEIEEQPRQEPTPPIAPENWAAYVDQVAQRYLNPQMSTHFANNFLKAFGVKDQATPEMAQGLSHVFTSGVINVLNSVLPDLFQSKVGERTFFQDQMERNYEGFSETHQMTNYERAWTKATADVKELAGKSLRDIGPQLEEAATKFAGSPEEFENMQFRGKDGKPLSAYQNAVKKYSVLAKMIGGQRLSPQEAQTFVEAGKKAARLAQVRREAGNLGSGKSNGQIAGKTSSGPFTTNNDLFDAEAMDLYKRQHGSL